MTEGTLYAGTTSGSYAIDRANGPSITSGEAIEIMLGGQWIAGHIEGSNDQGGQDDESSASTTPQNVGMYSITNDDDADGDTVTEASEESFPASDPPAWTVVHKTTPARTVNGYYFVADADGGVCGLCTGMHVRI